MATPDRGLRDKALNIINNVGNYGPLDATIDSYKQAADYADDARKYAELALSGVSDLETQIEKVTELATTVDGLEVKVEASFNKVTSLDVDAVDGSSASAVYDKDANKIHFTLPKGTDGKDGTDGEDGKSAYQSYLDTTTDNPKKTESEWIASLKGKDGVDGKDGKDGTNGTNGSDGRSAYELAVIGGYTGTLEDFNNLNTKSLDKNQNLSDLTNVASARSSLDVYSKGEVDADITSLNSSVQTSLSGKAAKGANSDITALSGLTVALSVAQGGTGGKTAADARTGLSAAKSGANSDITSLTALSGPLRLGADGVNDLDASTVGQNKIQTYKNLGDVRGWGAKCDGVTDDITAINQAIADTSGHITIPADVVISTHILFKNISGFSLKFQNNAKIKLNTSFVFNTSYRGAVVVDGCTSGIVDNLRVLGAKLDKLSAAEPWQDGDAGIEFVNSQGLFRINNLYVKDVKTWGAIHVQCPNGNFIYDAPYTEGCQVQSGIGGTGYNSLTVINPVGVNHGLYHIELETRDSNKRTSVVGGSSLLCNKGIAAVHNSDNILVSGHTATNCPTGFSFLSDNSSTEANRGDNQIFEGCVANSCKTSFELIYPRNASILNCSETRDDVEYYVRTRALDRIVKIANGKSYISLDSATENPNITANMVIQMDDGTQFTVGTVDTSVTTDSVFGNMLGFTTTTAMGSSFVRSTFKRYVQVSTQSTSVVLYGGSNVTIKGNNFSRKETVLASYGDHAYLQWKNNTTYNCVNYFAVGSTGTVSGNIIIERNENQNISSLGSLGKFASVLGAERYMSFTGGSNNATTSKKNVFPIDEGYISSIKCFLNPDQTTTGTIVLKVNNSDTISGFSGTPMSGSVVLSTPISVKDVMTIQLVDTVGDLIVSGYSVQVYGSFK